MAPEVMILSKYTTELRFVCEKMAGREESAGYADVNDIISKAIPKIFDFFFPIFDEQYRNVLCTKILKHYYTQEIGFETYGLWKLKLDTKLNEIMPYYNKMYESELLEYNPLYDTDVTTQHTGETTSENTLAGQTVDRKTGSNVEAIEREGTQHDEAAGNSEQYDLYSDTPQNGLTGVDNENYLTNARKITNDTTSEQDSNYENGETKTTTFGEGNTRSVNNTDNVNSTDEYVDRVFGKSGGQSFAKMIQEFRESFLNIDLLVINDLQDLFMEVW